MFHIGITIPVDVDIEYFPGKSAKRSLYGPPVDPDEPAEVIIKEVIHDGKKIELSNTETELLSERILEIITE